ncbi:MAG: C39 family peptidase [Proteobacteria bacterium]|nr:C39 family peptidase [Pseudomonadota bacterium]
MTSVLAALPVYVSLHAGHALALKQLGRAGFPEAYALILQGIACMACAAFAARRRGQSLVPADPKLQATRLVLAGASLTLITMSYWHVNAATVEMIASLDVALLILTGGWTGERYTGRQRALAFASLLLGAFLVIAARGPAERVLGYGLAFLGTLGITVGYLVLRRSSRTENDAVTSFVAGLSILLYGFGVLAWTGAPAPSASGAGIAALAGAMMFAIYELTLFLYRRMDIGSAEYPTLVSALLVLPLERLLFGTQFGASYVLSIVANVAVLGLALFSAKRGRVALERAMPAIQQSTPINCGPASLESVLRYWDVPSPGQTALAERLTLASNNTAHPAFLSRLAGELGLEAEFLQGLELRDLEAFVGRGETPIVVWWFDDGGHYSVLTAIDDAHVHLMDPWPDPAFPDQYRKVPRASFEANWYGTYCRRAAIRITGERKHARPHLVAANA